MELEDRLTIETPEGVNLEVTLAGLGSRAGAAAIDTLILGFISVLVIVAIVVLGSSDVSEDVFTLVVGIGALVVFLTFFGYFLLFEALNSGRTPGKAALGIRVIRLDGAPLSLGGVAIRTLLRIVDALPTFYAVGVISILSTERNQRVGDLAAGTVVVRDRRPALPPEDDRSGEWLTDLPAWDTSAVTADEVALLRRFMERRGSLTPAKRGELSASLASRLRVKVHAPDAPRGDEDFLIRLVGEKLHRRR